MGKLSRETPPPREGEPMGACWSQLEVLEGDSEYLELHLSLSNIQTHGEGTLEGGKR